jgi:hypothetical protein
MGVVVLRIRDDNTSYDCDIEVMYNGNVSDKMKDFFSDPEYWNVIRDSLSDAGFFSESTVQ